MNPGGGNSSILYGEMQDPHKGESLSRWMQGQKLVANGHISEFYGPCSTAAPKVKGETVSRSAAATEDSKVMVNTSGG